MALNNIQTNRIELQGYLELIFKIPEKLNKIDIDVKKELLAYIDSYVLSLSGTIFEIINNNPNYPYPENQLTNKLFEYWEVRISQVFNIPQLKDLKILIEKSIVDETKVKSTIKENAVTNPYELIFVNGKIYECFCNYIQNYIFDLYIDYSYLKKRMQKERFIHRVTDKDFMNFLLNDMKIKNAEKLNFAFINNDSKFISLGNSQKDPKRITNFNLTFESCF